MIKSKRVALAIATGALAVLAVGGGVAAASTAATGGNDLPVVRELPTTIVTGELPTVISPTVPAGAKPAQKLVPAQKLTPADAGK